MTAAEMLAEFHRAFAHPKTNDPDLRPRLHDEEHHELISALVLGDRAHIARELADVVYVAYGTALIHNIDLDAALAEVHRSNMTKRGVGGRVVRRPDGKVVKPAGFVAPDMQGALL